jgi:hypothetical protein
MRSIQLLLGRFAVSNMIRPTPKSTMPIGTVSKMKYAKAPPAQFGTTAHSGVIRTAIAATNSGESAKIGDRHIRTKAAFLLLGDGLFAICP